MYIKSASAYFTYSTYSDFFATGYKTIATHLWHKIYFEFQVIRWSLQKTNVIVDAQQSQNSFKMVDPPILPEGIYVKLLQTAYQNNFSFLPYFVHCSQSLNVSFNCFVTFAGAAQLFNFSLKLHLINITSHLFGPSHSDRKCWSL